MKIAHTIEYLLLDTHSVSEGRRDTFHIAKLARLWVSLFVLR